MKYRIALAIMTTIALSPINLCLANDAPSNVLAVEYQESADTTQFNIDELYHIPVATYQYLDEVFTSFYNKITFKTTIADNTFINSAHYDLIAIPLIAENKRGFQVELFGNFTDPETQQLSNVSTDQALYSYYSNTQRLDINNSTFSLGAGFSFNTSSDGQIKVIISNNEVPGYGSSNALIGFQTRF